MRKILHAYWSPGNISWIEVVFGLGVIVASPLLVVTAISMGVSSKFAELVVVVCLTLLWVRITRYFVIQRKRPILSDEE